MQRKRGQRESPEAKTCITNKKSKKMKKKITKTEGINATVETISNVLDIIESAAAQTENIEVAEVAEVVETATSETTANAIANIHVDMMDAVGALETAVKALKREAVTLRSLVRCIADNAQDQKIGLLANAFGLTATSNKREREACVINIIKHLPYYIETRVNDTIHTTPAKLTRKADNVYLAAAQTNYFEVLKDVVKNMMSGADNILHVSVIAGKYYDNNMQQVADQKQAKLAAKAASDKAGEARADAKVAEAKELLGITDVENFDPIGLLQAAAIRCEDRDALKHIMQAIELLSK